MQSVTPCPVRPAWTACSFGFPILGIEPWNVPRRDRPCTCFIFFLSLRLLFCNSSRCGPADVVVFVFRSFHSCRRAVKKPPVLLCAVCTGLGPRKPGFQGLTLPSPWWQRLSQLSSAGCSSLRLSGPPLEEGGQQW